MTTGEVARFWNVSEETVRRRVRRGEVPCVRLGADERAPVRYRPEDVAGVCERERSG